LIIERIWTANPFRNFNYLVACPETGDALAIDPLDYTRCLDAAAARGWNITQIVNTHEHGDHIGGNKAMAAATGASIIAHAGARASIPNVDRGVTQGDIIAVGDTVRLECLDTPGHTMSHVCLLSQTDQPALFSGDTLFNAGAGNCHNGGHPEELYDTFVNILYELPHDTRVYPGHDYLVNNLKFTLDREPGNREAADMLARYEGQEPAERVVTTLEQEREINTFFRLRSPDVIARLRESFPDLEESPTPKTVFLKLRELRNAW
jgi:hydroxyacylglutathione hydrolase